MRRFVVTGFVLIIVAMAGLAGGYLLRAQQAAVPIDQPHITSSPVTAQARAIRPPNHKTYTVSPPSRGAAISKISVPVSMLENGLYRGLSDPVAAADVKTGQTAMFFLANGEKELSLGAVTRVMETVDARAKKVLEIIVTPLSGRIGNPSAIAQADIVTENRNDAERLPRSAIVMKDGLPHLWEVTSNPDGTKSAWFKRTDILMESGDAVAVFTPSKVSNVFITDPDKALEDGDKINTALAYYAGEEHSEDRRLAMDIETRYPPSPGPDPYTGPDIPSACELELAAAAPAPSGQNATADFIAKIRAMSSQDSASGANPMSLPQ